MPTRAQQTSIKKSIDCARFIYNQLKATKETAYRSYGVSLSKYDLHVLLPGMKKSHPWLKEIHSQAAQDVSDRLDSAFQKFYSGGGYPKWAKKGKYSSVTFPQSCAAVSEGVLKLPKLGEVRFKDTRGLEPGTPIKQATVMLDHCTGRFSVSLTIEKEFEEYRNNGKAIGIDLGVAKLASFSDGKQINNPAFYSASMKKLRVLQRKMARQEKYGRNWRKTLKRVQALQRKTAGQRKDFLHKLTTGLINENQVIVLEKLAVRNMSRSAKGTAEEYGKNVKAKSGLNRSLLDAGMYSFRLMLEYKADRHGREVIAVDPKHTSQMCSECGHTAKENRRSQAEFLCVSCGHEENADVNAAKNILGKGIPHKRQRGALARA